MKTLTPLCVVLSAMLCALLFSDAAWAELTRKPLESTGSSDISNSLLKVTGGLLLVIVAIFGSAWLFRRFGSLTPISHDQLKVIGGVSMGQKERVVLMQVGEEQVLLGVSPGRIQTLHVLQKPIEVKLEKDQEKSSFSSQLNAAIRQWKSS